MKTRLFFALVALFMFGAVAPAGAAVIDPISVTHFDKQEITSTYTVTFTERQNWLQIYTTAAEVYVVLFYHNGSSYVQKVPVANSPLSYVPIPAGTAMSFENLADVVRAQITPVSPTTIYIYGSQSRFQVN